MARTPNLERYSYNDLVTLRSELDMLIEHRKAEEKNALKAKLADLARQQGFELADVLGLGGKRAKVAAKYRDPENPANTWTGRGRMPLWMVAATRKRGVKKEDFLI